MSSIKYLFISTCSSSTRETDRISKEVKMSSCEGKSSWPELVGVNGEAATVIIMRENPKVKANTVKEGSPVSGDFRCDRVRVFIDDNHIVTLVPKIG